SATVNLAMNTGTITYIDGYVVTQDIIDKIQKLGFQVTIYQEKQEKENDSIQKRKQLQLFCSILLSLPFIYMMIAHTPFRTYIDVPSILMNPWVQLLLVTPIQFMIGWQFHSGAYKSLRNKSANMDVL